ncbi:MAG: ABC transporter ATP-binding protein [Thermanaerothrix sp.]|jgi:NitT/TauT family transport system ATP-binding protein|uniref:ABC transporter ATP-binding protein n=2 Tax=Thermanaerothrix TaxID=1077886 RepID=A0ABU3NNY3_9CHLR|nr:ABC transporter ATP-binding protein [Thermanaerothrix sp. 4228-RoL]MDT8898552.1 ABC transporter ATP-binding protein [Thermanaerothrix sp. 4228-RoL]
MTEVTPPALDISHLSVNFENGSGELQALDDVTFQVWPQEFVCLLGPSGSGKSTLLRVLAGLVPPTRGEIRFSGDHPPRIGYVFQHANLMPWRTVIENIMLPLELQGVSPPEARRQAQTWVERVGLSGFESAWPRDLSGGMAQRVAIARALIHDPDLLLLDEPFGALDALTRERMGAELLHLWQSQRKTVLMVTHSISEALLLADRVLVFTPRPGRVSLDLTVPLPRPRSDDLRYTLEFAHLARQLRQAIG